MEQLLIRSSQNDYTVEVLQDAGELVEKLASLSGAFLVVDRNVKNLYETMLEPLITRFPSVLLDATEEEKTLAGASKVLDFLGKSGATRQSCLVAVGGGIIQDIAAFAAHVYYRGIKWVFLPTTLLSMADSCIGAKCGLNFNAFKNQVGVFHSPEKVLIGISFVKTLSDDAIRSGYGEILKLVLTGPPQLLSKLKTAVDESGFRNPHLSEFVYDCLKIKKEIIEIDEFDTGVRVTLNYGHTFGHALETITNYEVPHGLAIAWGMDLANKISTLKGILSESAFREIHSVIADHFSFRISRKIAAKELIDCVSRDKKVMDNKINLVLLQCPGYLKIVPTEFDSSLTSMVQEYLTGENIILRS
jgi:3-dehydroquinate synthase